MIANLKYMQFDLDLKGFKVIALMTAGPNATFEIRCDTGDRWTAKAAPALIAPLAAFTNYACQVYTA
jgi:hypothetical protein